MKNKLLKIYFFITTATFPMMVYAGTIKDFLTELTQIVGTTLLIALGGLAFAGFTINIIKLMRSVGGKDQSEIKSRLFWSLGLLLVLISLFGIIGTVQEWFNFPNYFQNVDTVDENFIISPEVIDTSAFQ